MSFQEVWEGSLAWQTFWVVCHSIWLEMLLALIVWQRVVGVGCSSNSKGLWNKIKTLCVTLRILMISCLIRSQQTLSRSEKFQLFDGKRRFLRCEEIVVSLKASMICLLEAHVCMLENEKFIWIVGRTSLWICECIQRIEPVREGVPWHPAMAYSLLPATGSQKPLKLYLYVWY